MIVTLKPRPEFYYQIACDIWALFIENKEYMFDPKMDTLNTFQMRHYSKDYIISHYGYIKKNIDNKTLAAFREKIYNCCRIKI